MLETTNTDKSKKSLWKVAQSKSVQTSTLETATQHQIKSN